MTKPSKKRSERIFVEKAAELLGKNWCINGPDRERPDFIVTEGEQQFGLEICEIFKGGQNKAGSFRKEKEAETQRAVNAFQQKYEQHRNIPLIVKFVGDMCDENMAAVLPALFKMELLNKPPGHQEDIIQVDKGEAPLRVQVTRAYTANWFCVNDRVGFVDCNPIEPITEMIKKKSKKLPDYKRCSGFDDIRLLIVANRIMNSGKLSLPKRSALDLKGFHVVYFLSYPEKVQIFN